MCLHDLGVGTVCDRLAGIYMVCGERLHPCQHYSNIVTGYLLLGGLVQGLLIWVLVGLTRCSAA